MDKTTRVAIGAGLACCFVSLCCGMALMWHWEEEAARERERERKKKEKEERRKAKEATAAALSLAGAADPRMEVILNAVPGSSRPPSHFLRISSPVVTTCFGHNFEKMIFFFIMDTKKMCALRCRLNCSLSQPLEKNAAPLSKRLPNKQRRTFFRNGRGRLSSFLPNNFWSRKLANSETTIVGQQQLSGFSRTAN